MVVGDGYGGIGTILTSIIYWFKHSRSMFLAHTGEKFKSI